MELHVKFYLLPYVKADFTIINPPTIPAEGELVRFHWEDFLTDQHAIDTVRKIQEDTVFLADIQCRMYTQDYVLVVICLLTEYDYYKNRAETQQYIAESLKAGHMIDLDM
jgi:hypothetical protein